MTSFQYKSYNFINLAIKRIVEYIKANAKKQCFFVNLKNPTFWVKTSRGEEILTFFKEMTDNQQFEFIGFFDIFIICFGQNGSPFFSMTANQLSPTFKHTVFISISRGYNQFKECCALRSTTPSIDLRSSIGNSQSPIQLFERRELSTSPFGSGFSSVERAFRQDATHFGGGPANVQYSPFQEHGPWSFGGGPASNFSFFSSQPPTALGGNATHQSQFDRTPVCSLFDQNPFTSNADFVPLQLITEPLHSPRQLKIVKGRVVRVEIPSGCSSGPSTSSTVGVGGIAKKSPMTPTPITTKIANLEKKISKLESQNPREGSLNFLELQTLVAKLEKIRNSL